MMAIQSPRLIDAVKEAVAQMEPHQRTALAIEILNKTDDPHQVFQLRRAASVATTVADTLERAEFLQRELRKAEGQV